MLGIEIIALTVGIEMMLATYVAWYGDIAVKDLILYTLGIKK